MSPASPVTSKPGGPAPEVSLVIPNWNGVEHLAGCLDSVARQRKKPVETVVVDNGSTDGSRGLLERSYPWVRVIGFETNRGFAAAVNSGIQSSRGEFVALLNNDTELDPGWLEHLTAGLVAHPEAGSAASLMLDFHQRHLIDSAGDMLSRSGVPLARGFGLPVTGEYLQQAMVFGACAGAGMYRRSLFRSVGLFEEGFISYLEDADLAFRARLAGHVCLFVPQAVCYHKRGATARVLPGFVTRMLERNLILFYARNLPGWALFRLLPVLAGARLRHMIRAVRSGNGGASLAGFFEGIAALPRMLPARRRIQGSRSIDNRAVMDLFGKETL